MIPSQELEQQNLLSAPPRKKTSLVDKNLFLDCVARSLARMRRHGDDAFAVVYIDLDRFNLVNDSLGHAVGGALLDEIGRKLQHLVREEDAVAHLMGDRFAVLLEKAGNLMDGAHAVRRIQQALESPTEIAGHQIVCTASIGIALVTSCNSEPEKILNDAETAMHRARTRGPGQYQVFDPDMHEQAIQQLRLESDLRGALDRNELRLEYQPIVCVGTGNVVGFEALLRWQHPERGLLYPSDLLHVAESLRLHIAINRWVLREASSQVAEWQRRCPNQPRLFVSVNMTNQYLARQELVRDITALISEYAMDASSLVLEITEDQLVEDPELAAAILADLASLGIKTWVDDFGTGYSSLSYLARFPVHALKIDRSFVMGLNTNPKCLSIIRAIISLAENMGLAVIAEGVESEEQLEVLRREQCQFVQGYYLSRPFQPEIIAWFIDKWSTLNDRRVLAEFMLKRSD